MINYLQDPSLVYLGARAGGATTPNFKHAGAKYQ